MIPNPPKPTLRQAVCLLLASAGLGLASNALNPAGIRWRDTNDVREIKGSNSAGGAGVYRNETFYENQSASAQPMPQTTLARGQDVRLPPAGIVTGVATPLRSTWAEVKPMVESGQIVLVDARARTAFDAGHIPGAVCLPLTSLQTEIKAFIAAHPPVTPLAIYCANANCGTSSQLAKILAQTYNYKEVRYLPGGYQEWRNAEGK